MRQFSLLALVFIAALSLAACASKPKETAPKVGDNEICVGPTCQCEAY